MEKKVTDVYLTRHKKTVWWEVWYGDTCRKYFDHRRLRCCNFTLAQRRRVERQIKELGLE